MSNCCEYSCILSELTSQLAITEANLSLTAVSKCAYNLTFLLQMKELSGP